MTEINVTVRGASAVARLSGALTEKAVGIKAEFVFDEAWDNLSKVIVFRSGDKATNGIEIDGIATVPWELLTAGEILSVGIVGRSLDGKVVIPTVWADCGMVKPSAAGVEPGDPEPEPSPDVVEQINQKADEAYRKAAATEKKMDKFEPEPGGHYTPTVDEDGNLRWTASKPNMPEIPGSNIQGKDGYTPVKGKDYFDGEPGYTPVKGKDYVDGKDGKTPEKGVDYFTEADKQEIADRAAELVKIPEGFSGSWDDLTDKPFDVGEPVYATLYSATKEITEAEVGNQTYIEVDAGYRRSDRRVVTHPNCKIVCKIGDEVFERVMWNGIGTAVNEVGILGYHNGKQVGYDGPMRLNNKTGIYLARIYFTPSKPCTVTAEYQYFTGYTAEDDAWVPHSIARVDDIPDAVVNPATAEVGQTIVVKAVDENGKPTEWDSADLVESVNSKTGVVKLTAEDVGAEPKSGEMELLEKIVLEEEVKEVVREIDPDGSPYNLSAIRVKVRFNNLQQKGSLHCVTYKMTTMYTILSDVACAITGATSESYKNTALAEVKPEFGMYSSVMRYGVQGGYMTPFYPPNANYVEEPTTNKIKKVRLYIYDNVNFAAGTEIEIYGVRANEN